MREETKPDTASREPPGGLPSASESRAARLRRARLATRRRLGRASGRDLGPPFDRRMAMLALGAALLVVSLMPFDGRISQAMLDEPAGVAAFFGIATDIGLSAWYVYPPAALALFVALADWRHLPRIGRRRVASFYAHAVHLSVSVASAALLTQVLKTLFGRARPALLDAEGPFSFRFIAWPHLYASFPSGHSTTLGAVTMVLMLWFKPLRVPVLVIGACFALSRIVVRAHYPSDVAAGFTIGALVSLALARWLARRRVLFGYEPTRGGGAALLPVRVGHWRDCGAATVFGRLATSARWSASGRSGIASLPDDAAKTRR